MSLELLKGCLNAGERVVCAVSGGADSMALLYSLLCLRESLCITVQAAHFNHRLRGAESERDEAFVRDFCEKNDIFLHLGSGDVRAYAQNNGKTLEEAARILRYEFLQSLPCDKIATAHTADDNAETVLLHLLRGSGLTGLCGIAPIRGRIVRPLLHVTRAQIEQYLYQEGISWVDDSSNTCEDFARNRLRHTILPLLKRENPNLLQTVSRQSELLRQDDAYLDSLAHELVKSAQRDGKFDCQSLLSAPDALQRRALRLIVRRFLAQDVSMQHICDLQKLLSNPSASASLSLPHGLQAQKCYGLLRLCFQSPCVKETELQIPGQTLLAELGMKITCKITKNLQIFSNTPFHFCVKYDMIAQHGIFARPRRSGDALTLSCRKSLKKWFIERKIPVFDREKLPVFVTGDTVLAVAGLGVERSFCAKEGDEALIITIESLPPNGEII